MELLRSMEYIDTLVSCNNRSVRLIVVYRLEADAYKKKIPQKFFLDDFSDM